MPYPLRKVNISTLPLTSPKKNRTLII